MKVCFVTSECVPYAKAGGLGDVSGALPIHLKRLNEGIDIRVVLPLYASIQRDRFDLRPVPDFPTLQIPVGPRKEAATVWMCPTGLASVATYFIESSTYFDRPTLYSDAADEAQRFIFFQRAVLEFLLAMNWVPDVLHANDWTTGLLPAYIKEHPRYAEKFANTSTVLSIHNIGYQGVFKPSSVLNDGFPPGLTKPFQPLEYYGKTSFLKAGIALADVVATVSPTYALEIQRPEFGMGLDGDIRSRGNTMSGILNGIDEATWNPESDPLIPFRYGIDTLDQKKGNKQALLSSYNMISSDDVPVVGIVSRLTEQKGFHLLTPILTDLLASDTFSLILLGNGDAGLQRKLAAAQAKFPERMGVFFGYDEPHAHLIEAGADMFLMPSIYEPCGLNQMYSLRYGTIPIVRNTGGLADTVRDIDDSPTDGNGFTFQAASPAALRKAISRACEVFSDKKKWRSMQQRGMSLDFSWESSARAYLNLYESARIERS